MLISAIIGFVGSLIAIGVEVISRQFWPTVVIAMVVSVLLAIKEERFGKSGFFFVGIGVFVIVYAIALFSFLLRNQ